MNKEDYILPPPPGANIFETLLREHEKSLELIKKLELRLFGYKKVLEFYANPDVSGYSSFIGGLLYGHGSLARDVLGGIYED